MMSVKRQLTYTLSTEDSTHNVSFHSIVRWQIH